MATRHVPARRGAVFDDFAVGRPTATDALLRRPDGTREAFADEAISATRARRSVHTVLSAMTMTLAQYASKRAYLRSIGYSRSATRRKALWHLR
jgi:hypothetical protein